MTSKGFILFSNKMRPLLYQEMKEIHTILKSNSDTKLVLKKRINESTTNAVLDMWDELTEKERMSYEIRK